MNKIDLYFQVADASSIWISLNLVAVETSTQLITQKLCYDNPSVRGWNVYIVVIA